MERASTSELIEQAAILLATNPIEAEERALSIIKRVPGDPRAMLIVGSARRRQGDPVAALRILAPLAKTFPKAVKTNFELGAALSDLGRTEDAIAALQYTLTLDPEFSEAWRALGDQLFLAGDLAAAEQAFAQNVRTSVRTPHLKRAAEALAHKEYLEAEELLRAYLTSCPNDSEALRLMGNTLVKLGRYADAEVLLAFCLDIDPSQDGARFCYAEALFHQQKAVAARGQVEELLLRNPKDPAYLNLFAACLGLLGDDARVDEIYRNLLKDYSKQPGIWLNYGHTLRTVGKSNEALAAYRRCIAMHPTMGEAYWSIADLKVTTFTAEEVKSMLQLIDRTDLEPHDRLHLHYALGKSFEDRRNYESSFKHYERAARIRRSPVTYSRKETTALTQRTVALFTQEFFANRRGSGFASKSPIFIVGLPRSGSTLIEQILASHSKVEGTRELPDVGLIARGLGWAQSNSSDPYPYRVATLKRNDLSSLGSAYLQRTAIHRKLEKPVFLDKMPNNFQHIGLINLILPNAKIIDARRHPLGACFSSYKQHFAQGQAFSYDLDDLGYYYRDYIQLMKHFDMVMPQRIHRVIYEDLVDDTENEVRRLLDYCELQYEESCLEFYKNPRSVRTVSSEQVRRPIFRDGINQWKNYEPWLGPLKAALGPALEVWR
jgi:tetratricopeptide (TPR) repeat protein